MTLYMSFVRFTDENRANLDGHDTWANVWVFFADERHQRFLCQGKCGGVIFSVGIIGDRVVGRVPEYIKVTEAAYCNHWKEVLHPGLDLIHLSVLRTLIFMHKNAHWWHICHTRTKSKMAQEELSFIKNDCLVNIKFINTVKKCISFDTSVCVRFLKVRLCFHKHWCVIDCMFGRGYFWFETSLIK